MSFVFARSALVGTALFAALGCASLHRHAVYLDDPKSLLHDGTSSMVCMPLDSMSVRYQDNTKSRPIAQFDDSFFLKAANDLLSFEAGRRHSLRPFRSDLPDTAEAIEPLVSYSELAEDRGDSVAAARRAVRLCERFGADLVLVPYSCSLAYAVHQEEPWRRGRGPSYDRPIKHAARSVVHVQVWDRSGRLLYERIASNSRRRPTLYPLFGRNEPDKDIVRYAGRLFAPPLVKALHGAVRVSLDYDRP